MPSCYLALLRPFLNIFIHLYTLRHGNALSPYWGHNVNEFHLLEHLVPTKVLWHSFAFLWCKLKDCYRWSWFEARSKICSAERQARIREKEFRMCTIHWCIVSVWTLRLLISVSWLCLSREGRRLAFSSGYYDSAALLGTVLSMPFQHTSVRQLLNLRSGGCEASTGWVGTS